MSKTLTLVVCSLVLCSAATAGTADGLHNQAKPRVPNEAAAAIVDGYDQVHAVKVGDSAPRTDEPLGDLVVVGTTRYDYQSNGTQNKMLAVSSDGVVHGSFMGGADPGANRRVQAWCVDPDLLLTGPLNVLDQHSGYTTHDVTGPAPGNGLAPNSGVVGNHTSSPAVSWFGVDFGGCTLAFNMIQGECGIDVLWPHITVDTEDRVHSISYGTSDSQWPNSLFYRASSDGMIWDGECQELTDNSEALAAIPVASSTGSRVAAVYHEKTPYEDMPYDMGEGFIGIQIHHDIRMFLAEDYDVAQEIDAGNSINVTHFGPDNDDVPFGAYGQRGYCDVDGIFDYTEDENLHLTYTGGPQWTDTLHIFWAEDDTAQFVYMHWNLGRGQIWHHNYDAGTWSHVWGSNAILGEDDPSWVDAGAWRQRQDRPSFGIDSETGYFYCAWNQYSADDTTSFVDANQSVYPNGEIYVSCSADNGETWGEPVNVTNTPTPGCDSGDCLSESWHTLASVVDGYLHLQWIEDTCPGGLPQDECEETLNNVVYQRISVDEVPPHDGTPWNTEGRVGLAQTSRWYKWYADSWCGDEVPLDSCQWIDPIHLLNESPYDVQLEKISFHYDAMDEIGVGAYTEMGCTVHTGGGYIGVNGWDGVLDQWTATKFNGYLSYYELPLYDCLLGFHFPEDTGRPSLYYRFDFDNAVEEGEEPCTGVLHVDPADIGNYAELELINFLDVEQAPVPASFELAQNFPNPFNPSTEIAYTLERGARVELSVYSILGERVAVLEDGYRGAGRHRTTFDASGLASGVYFYRLEALGRSETRKMILAR